MNKFIYMVESYGQVRPYDMSRMWDEVPSHHSRMMEAYEEKFADKPTEERHSRALISYRGQYHTEAAATAMAGLALETHSSVCIWTQVVGEHSGPIGRYIIFER